jgi:hypothetical protein
MALIQSEVQDILTLLDLKSLTLQPQDNDKFFVVENGRIYDYNGTSVLSDDGSDVIENTNFVGRFLAIKSSNLTVNDWSINIDYLIGDLFTAENRVYRVTNAHTSVTLNADRANFEVIVSLNLGGWTTLKYFYENDTLIEPYTGRILICNTSHLSNNGNFELDRNNWDIIIPIYPGSEFAITTYYYVNELVLVNDIVYKRIIAGVSGIVFDASEQLNWLRIGDYYFTPKPITSTTYTVLDDDKILSIDSTLNNVNVVLPSTLPKGKFFTIQYIKTANTITFTPNGGNLIIDPATYLPVSSFNAYGLVGQYGTIKFFLVNNVWNFIG